MTTRRTPILRKPLIAALALFALIATACGSTVVQTTADRAAAAPAPAPGAAPAPAAPAESAAPAAPTAADRGAPLEHNSPNFGASIDEWTGDDAAGTADSGDSAYATIAWQDLIPPGSSGEEVIARFEDRLRDVEPGSDEATALYEEIQAAFKPDAVNAELDGREIRLAGFVAPLTYEDDIVTEFLLVPNFGACIHVPPPPPNQTIMVSVDKEHGLTVEEAWGPVWVEGTIAVSQSETVLAASSYSITNATSSVYDDF